MDLQNQNLSVELNRARQDNNDIVAEMNRLKLNQQEELHRIKVELMERQRDY